MPELKPPQNTKKENKKPKPQLSILTDIEKSAKADMERLGSIISAQPQSGILGIADINKSARVISDIVSSPAFKMAGETLAATQKLATTLAEPMFRINEAGRAIIEPVQRIQESVIALNNQYRFDMSLKALSLLDTPALANPDFDWGNYANTYATFGTP